VALLHGDESLLAALEPGETMFLGTLDDAPVLALELPDHAALPADMRALPLRSLYGQLDEPGYGLAGFATQMLYWRRNSGFCQRCGSPTQQVPGDWGKRCTQCGHTAYPHVTPAIIVLVHDGERVLLTHKAGWGPRYSIIAGFVEPGESLEECVQREVREEAGLEVGALRYVGSQTWPYPHQIMIGYLASYASGEIAIDDKELDDARWFPLDALPDLPPPLSISRQIINMWIGGERA
ncbi:MAG: NAD(+) diphosphatase, partial [Chloroflexales bacterium]|nr:NAD(+) diphosphatase [Chloroflexales bacterium]